MIIQEPEVATGANGAVNPFVGVPNPNLAFSEYSQLNSATGQYFVQRQVRRGDDVVNQLFMKMIFVVFDNGDPKLVDPDFFCDR